MDAYVRALIDEGVGKLAAAGVLLANGDGPRRERAKGRLIWRYAVKMEKLTEKDH